MRGGLLNLIFFSTKKFFLANHNLKSEAARGLDIFIFSCSPRNACAAHIVVTGRTSVEPSIHSHIVNGNIAALALDVLTTFRAYLVITVLYLEYVAYGAH